MPKMSNQELAKLLEDMSSKAVGRSSSEFEQEQDENLKIYRGEPYGDEKKGQSQVVMRDASETVDWMLPDLIGVFSATDEAIEVRPAQEDDIEIAQQVSDYVKHTFWSDNNGVFIIYDFAFNGLVQKNGFVKVYWEDKKVVEEQTYEDLSLIQVQMFELEEDVEILSQESEDISDYVRAIATPEVAAQFPDGKKYTLRIRRETSQGRLRYEALPVAEVLYTARATSMQEAPYVAHRVAKTRTNLIAEGILTEAQIKKLAGDTNDNGNSKSRRDIFYDNQENEDADDIFYMYEEFVLVDFDGDGHPERRRIVRVGNKILENDYWDGVDIAVWSPKRLPTRISGQGLVDDVKDIQRVNTVVTRQTLDNMYLTNAPRKVVNMRMANENTIDDLLRNVIGGVVRTDGPPAEAIRTDTIDFFGSASFQVLDYMQKLKDKRTGVTHMSQGIPEDVFNESASYPLKLMAKAEQRKELILRLFAEGMKDIFTIALRTIKKHQDFERVVRMRNAWVTVNPATWAGEFQFDVKVGLGSGDKEQKVGYLGAILEKQIQAIESGTGLADAKKLYKTITDMVKAMGLGQASQYFNDPGMDGFEAPERGPSEAEIKAQNAIQLKQMELEAQDRRQQRELAAKIKMKAEELALEEELRKLEIEAETKLTAFNKTVDLKTKTQSGRNGKYSNSNIARD